MTYTSFLQVARDQSYLKNLPIAYRPRFDVYGYDYRNENITTSNLRKIRKIWYEHMLEDYEKASKTNSALGKFLSKYPLKLKEFCCLLELIQEDQDMSDFEKEAWIVEDDKKDLFKKHKVRFESSQLRKHKLVFKIVHPLRPMKTRYEVSYKAMLALENKKYTDAYEQLDMALEEESKINSPSQLDSLYYLATPSFGMNDIIISKNLKNSLTTAISREQKKDQIFKKWGLGKVIEYGRGTTLNFRGPPGTGKTMAAHCLAKELDKTLLIVRYDQLQNCFIGVTEKHIQQVFKIASTKNAILFFDEADAIALSRDFLERSWEMSQVNTLLKELERFEGMCIFATNYADKYDPAFERRLTMHLDFTLPSKEEAMQILEKILPKKARDKKLVLEGLELSGLSGGDIKNVILNAAGIAAKADADKIYIEHIKESIKMARKAKQVDDRKETGYIS